jgi:hypothetical protein
VDNDQSTGADGHPVSAGEAALADWIAEGTPLAANRLDELARTTASKDVRKAARRGLYLLSQRGIVPERTNGSASAPPSRGDDMRAWASAYDGAGNRLVIVVLPGSEGGNATVAQILANDELGVRDLTVERKRMREIAPLMERLEGQIEGGLAVAEIEPERARNIIQRFRDINFERSTKTPAGFIDLLPRIGAPVEPSNPTPAIDSASANGDGEDCLRCRGLSRGSSRWRTSVRGWKAGSGPGPQRRPTRKPRGSAGAASRVKRPARCCPNRCASVTSCG